jgi:hypothetical protein
MLLSIQSARYGLSKFCLLLSGMTGMSCVSLLFLLYQGSAKTNDLICIVIAITAIGFFLGLYLTYQTAFNSNYGMAVFFYWLFSFEIFCFGGAVAVAAEIGGRPDLKWMVFFSYVLTILVTLAGGMYNEATALKLKRTDQVDDWKEKLKKHVDFNNRFVKPSLTVDPRSLVDGQSASSSIWIGAAASVNIPLLFEAYGGGKYNAIFLVVPLMIGLFSYLHITLIGPALVRLLLLRKLEKSLGYRFINADYEQIQELRRTFFLSRWLMKDYVKPPDKAIATDGAVQRK